MSECQQVQQWPHSTHGNGHPDRGSSRFPRTLLGEEHTHHSRCSIEAVCTPSMSSNFVIEELRKMLAKFGLPEMIVTDNGMGFVSEEFELFLRSNGIKHTTSAPYHPASNGLAERAVQIGLKKVTSGSMNTRLAKHHSTGVSPAELLLGRRPHTRLDLLRPNTAGRVEERQQQQKQQHDSRAKVRVLKAGETVLVKNYGSGCRWLPGRIMEASGPVSFSVRLEDGRLRRCHRDQIRPRLVENGTSEMSQTAVDDNGLH